MYKTPQINLESQIDEVNTTVDEVRRFYTTIQNDVSPTGMNYPVFDIKVSKMG